MIILTSTVVRNVHPILNSGLCDACDVLRYSLIAEENVYCRLAPLIVTHSVSGSLPSCSFVAPVVLDTATGTVMGMVVLHVFPPAVYTFTDSILAPSGEVFQVMLGRHRSRVWRSMKACARSSCLRVLNGQVVLQDVNPLFST
jgi:hypothetical protein